jgi:hypothetical protein
MFCGGLSYKELNDKLVAILYPPAPPKVLFTFGEDADFVVDDAEEGVADTEGGADPVPPPNTVSSTQIQKAAKVYASQLQMPPFLPSPLRILLNMILSFLLWNVPFSDH